VADLKNDIQHAVSRFETATSTIQDNFRIVMKETNDSNGRWNRWAFVMAMLACIVSSVSVLICANVLLHLPR
jgi:hypothetical protein